VADSLILQTDLKQAYHDLNVKYFDGKLPEKSVKIEWSNRMTTTAGKIRYRDNYIRLSTYYLAQNSQEFWDVLLHEMLHIRAHGHGTAFKAEMYRVNKMGAHVTIHTQNEVVPKWMYKCTKCGYEWGVTRRYPTSRVYVCSKCKGKLIETKVS
jgi:predicted SprT family Zn-dependent metalloprotease